MSELSDCGKIFQDAADHVTAVMMSRGPKPGDAAQAALWEVTIVRLQGQASSLRTIAGNMFDLDALEILQSVKNKIGELTQATADAKDTIKTIASVNRIMEGFATLISVGTQIATFVANPTAAAAVALGSAVRGLTATAKSLTGSAPGERPVKA
jgi:hypothetical protein